MTQTQIQCFLAAAETLNFSRAAEKLMISQPSVSKMIAQLETEFGFPLFQRLRQGIALTPAGQIMERYLSDASAGFTLALENAARTYHCPTVRLRVGCLEGWDLTYFYRELREHFSRVLPNLELEIVGLNFSRVAQALKTGAVDVALTTEDALPDLSELRHEILTSTRYYVLFSAAEPPVPIRAHMQLEDFRFADFYVIGDPEKKGRMSHLMMDACLRHGFYPKLVSTMNLGSTLVRLQSSRGVFLVDEWLSDRANYLYRSVPTDIPCRICSVWIEDENPEKTAFVRELINFYQIQSIQ